MKKGIFSSLVLLSVLLLLSACAPETAEAKEARSDLVRDPAPQVSDADLAELAGGNNDFAFALYGQAVKGGGNAFYSPYSISVALAMTHAGARGQTSEQMSAALHFALPPDRLHPAFNKLAWELEGRSKSEELAPDQVFQLNVANSLWGQSGFHFEQEFLDLLAVHYAAGLRLADFRNDAEAARQEINDWVSDSTNQKIKDIIPPGALDELTRLVLANAVYFKAAWLHPFDAEFTEPGDFHLLDGSAVSAPMMRQQARLNNARGEGFTAVELPYAGRQLSMLILLPDEGAFESIEGRLNSEFVDSALAALDYGEVILSMPKFTFEWSAGLAGGLAALGMPDAFDPGRADFSGMDGTRDLFITEIIHKAFVAVDEAGTEAAAATVVIVGTTSAQPEPPLPIAVDRPFFFLIRDNPTGTILFLGRVMNPAV
ncbi:MAG: serpin family protein [Anaerolineales bacterium]|nr:serpin family protein [Anaerolineales bacterium]